MELLNEKREVLESLKQVVLSQYLTTPESLSFPPENADPIRARLKEFDFKKPIPLKELMAQTQEMIQKWNLNTCHPKYMGLFNGPAHFSSVIADALTAAWNPQLSVWSHSAASNEIEAHTIRFFLELFGFSENDSMGHFTSGGSEANATGVLCAVNHAFPSFKNLGGLAFKKSPWIYASEYAHHSVQKAVASVGIGIDHIRVVPADGDLRMDVRALNQMIQEDEKSGQPFCVVATAGTTSAGIIDPLELVAEVCAAKNLWLHVDAAWGGAAQFSPNLRKYLNGIERADSITIDAHKWLAVAMGAGLFLCRQKKTLECTFALKAEYMPSSVPNTTDFHKTSLQWSRRFMGLKVFFALAELGREGFKNQIEKQTQTGTFLRNSLKKQGWVILNPGTPLPVICFTHPLLQERGNSASEFLKVFYKKKTGWISETKIRGEMALRASITHPETSPTDVEELVSDLGDTLNILL